ncbi:hypothetical protein KDM87_00415 [Undibacterium sp. FT147W]|uniref:BioF2-like acetyltransferase domain-containing protein n=1 Tax=Undibacterium rivi TaxID=2828729 RepID=A0ABS5GY18_9BURK|nr:hypothetical protein [Undibacterium rivi]MBR7791042.1 hypothetical protein [Undibacterium rivi]
MNTSIPPRLVADALWLLTARSRGGNHWVSNAHCQIQTIEFGGHSHPVSLLEHSDWHECAASSPRSALLRAYRQRLKLSTSATARIADALSCLVYGPLSALMHTGKLDQAAVVANYLLPTNLYPAWDADDIQQMTTRLQTAHPQRPLMMPHLSAEVCPQLMQHLRNQGWKMIATRRVVLSDPQQSLQAGVWSEPDIEVVHQDQLTNSDLLELYALYLQHKAKQSHHLQTDFSFAFFELCLETGFVELTGLRWQGRWVGLLGTYTQTDSGWLTAPLMAWDQHLPLSVKPERLLHDLFVREAQQKQLRMHCSAELEIAPDCSHSAIEYTAIYDQHLQAHQKIANRWFSALFQQCVYRSS